MVIFLVMTTKMTLINSSMRIEKKKGNSGNAYVFYVKNKTTIGFEVVRPLRSDSSIVLCVPGAFTDLADYGIDGVFISNGKPGNTDKINHSLGGAVRIENGEAVIFPTNKGKLINDALLNYIIKKKGSLFQQIQMIENGVAATFKDNKLFQRRGIVTFKDGRTAIAESISAITLKTFADDLAGLEVKDLLYTDMGAWDEGWYRDPESGKIMMIGYDHSQTEKQSNWVVYRK